MHNHSFAFLLLYTDTNSHMCVLFQMVLALCHIHMQIHFTPKTQTICLIQLCYGCVGWENSLASPISPRRPLAAMSNEQLN